VSAVGSPVITVEGLPAGGRLRPVQQAFIDEQAAQCGYRTSGMVAAAAGLLRDRPAPTEQEARKALDGNLCRCGVHARIIRAVLKAAGRASGAPAVAGDPSAGQPPASQAELMDADATGNAGPARQGTGAIPAAGRPGRLA
jgi:xanthine dehydrogenase iron-sulfur cluster and FAD-binding subunit A